MKTISYIINTNLTQEEFEKGLKEKCSSAWSLHFYNPADKKIRFRRYEDKGGTVLIPLVNHRNSARKNHRLKFVENADGNRIEVTVETHPLVTLFFLIWWTMFLLFAISAMTEKRYFILPGLGLMGVFASLTIYFCRKKANEELPQIKQALREIIAEIEVDCGK